MVLAMPMMAVCYPMITQFQAMGRVKESLICSVLRKGVLDIPLLFLLNGLLPMYGCTMLFSFVWYWNETTQAALLFGTVIKTLPMKLGSFAASYTNLYGTTGSHSTVNEAISLAGTFLSILPLLVLYIIMQKQFVESIEKVGITGE